jgi:hypothetical protein
VAFKKKEVATALAAFKADIAQPFTLGGSSSTPTPTHGRTRSKRKTPSPSAPSTRGGPAKQPDFGAVDSDDEPASWVMEMEAARELHRGELAEHKQATKELQATVTTLKQKEKEANSRAASSKGTATKLRGRVSVLEKAATEAASRVKAIEDSDSDEECEECDAKDARITALQTQIQTLKRQGKKNSGDHVDASSTNETSTNETPAGFAVGNTPADIIAAMGRFVKDNKTLPVLPSAEAAKSKEVTFDIASLTSLANIFQKS